MVRAMESSLGHKGRLSENVMEMSWAVTVPSWAIAVVGVKVLTPLVLFTCVLILQQHPKLKALCEKLFYAPA